MDYLYAYYGNDCGIYMKGIVRITLKAGSPCARVLPGWSVCEWRKEWRMSGDLVADGEAKKVGS
jgi:hypothetical protein